MYGLLIPSRHPPVPVCDEPPVDLPKRKEAPADNTATEPETAPWPPPPRPLERELDPEC